MSRLMFAVWIALLATLSSCGSGSPVEEPEEAREVMGLVLGPLEIFTSSAPGEEGLDELLASRMPGSFLVMERAAGSPGNSGPGPSSLIPAGSGYSRLVLNSLGIQQKSDELLFTVAIAMEDPAASLFADTGTLEQSVQLTMSGRIANEDWQGNTDTVRIDWQLHSLGSAGLFTLRASQQARRSSLADWETEQGAAALPQRVLAFLAVDELSLRGQPLTAAASASDIDSFISSGTLAADNGVLLEFRLNELGGYDLQKSWHPGKVLLGSLDSRLDILRYGSYQQNLNQAIVSIDETALGQAWREVQPFGEYRWPLTDGEELRLRAAALDQRQSAIFSLPGIAIQQDGDAAHYAELDVPCRLHLMHDWSLSAADEAASRLQWRFAGMKDSEYSGLTEEELHLLLLGLQSNMSYVLSGPVTDSAELNTQPLLYLRPYNSGSRPLLLRMESGDNGSLSLSNTIPVAILMPDGSHAVIDGMTASINRDSLAGLLANPLSPSAGSEEIKQDSYRIDWHIEGSKGDEAFSISASQLSWISL